MTPYYEDLRARLVQCVKRICPRWLADQAEDIVQVAMLRLLEIHKRPEQAGGLSPSYLWRVAYTATVDEIRRVRRRQECSVDETVAGDSAPAARADAEEAQAMRDLKKAVRDCLERMNDARRVVVELHLLGDELSEMEGVTGWAPKKVRNLLYRGLANLRRCLGAKGVRP